MFGLGTPEMLVILGIVGEEAGGDRRYSTASRAG